MTMGPVCTCFKVWGSILPPPPCGAHSASSTISFRFLACRGRHCEHDDQCYRAGQPSYTATWTA